jgi:hypothetical protein
MVAVLRAGRCADGRVQGTLSVGQTRIRFLLFGLACTLWMAGALTAPLVVAEDPAPRPATPSNAPDPAQEQAAAVRDPACASEPRTWTPATTAGPEGESVERCLRRLGRGQTDLRIPADQSYVLTTFGGPGDEQPVDCGDPRGADGKWYYAANLQRFACGQKVRLVDAKRRRCVVVEVADTGPHICVETAGGRPMWDVSPLASLHLYGLRSTGWSNGRTVHGAPVDASNELGPCDEQLQSAAEIGRGSVGGVCRDASECRYAGALCLGADSGWPGGYCSARCGGSCPSLAGPHSLSICSRLPDGSAGCLARCDFTLHERGCRDGYRCDRAPATDSGAQTEVCLPDRCEVDTAVVRPAGGRSTDQPPALAPPPAP